MELHVDVLREADLRAVNSLRYLLSPSPGQAGEVTGMSLADAVSCPAATVYVARDGRMVIGTLTLVVAALPSGLRAWAEDFAIDDAEDWRRERAAEALLATAMQACRQARVSMLKIVSSVPPDAAAERALSRLGFERAGSAFYTLATS